MRLPGITDTGIPKAIAIVATIGILAFGLCTANLFVPPARHRAMAKSADDTLQAPIPLRLILSIVVLIVLIVINAFRRSGSKDDQNL